jgi:hypothetical protein
MPTDISLVVLAESGNCLVLTPSGSGNTLSSSEYSIESTKVAARTFDAAWNYEADPYGSGYFFLNYSNGVLLDSSGGNNLFQWIMSVNRDVGITDGDTYYLNIPLMIERDVTVVLVQLKLTGTRNDSNGWFGTKCTPFNAGLPWDGTFQSSGAGTIAVSVSQQPAWDSDWILFGDSGGTQDSVIIPGPAKPLSTLGGQFQDAKGAIGSWSWFVPSAGVFYSIYLIATKSDENDDLSIVITDQYNDPVAHGNDIPGR